MVLTFYVSEEGVLKGVCLKIGELYIHHTFFYNIIFELVYLLLRDPLKPSFWDNFEISITFVDVDFCYTGLIY